MKFGVKDRRTGSARLWDGITSKEHLSRAQKETAAVEESFKLLQDSVSAKRESKH